MASKFSSSLQTFSLNIFAGVCRRTSLLPVLCYQAADGERPHWLHHRRGTLLTQWGQAHQTTDWLQDAGKGFTCPRAQGLKRGHLICFQGRQERKRVVMGCWSWDEQRDIKLSLSRLTCRGHRSGDLTSCWDQSCQGREQGFGMRKKEIDYAYLSAQAERCWSSLLPPVVLSPLYQQQKLRHYLVHPSVFSSATSVCSLHSGSTNFQMSKTCPRNLLQISLLQEKHQYSAYHPIFHNIDMQKLYFIHLTFKGRLKFDVYCSFTLSPIICICVNLVIEVLLSNTWRQ